MKFSLLYYLIIIINNIMIYDFENVIDLQNKDIVKKITYDDETCKIMRGISIASPFNKYMVGSNSMIDNSEFRISGIFTGKTISNASIFVGLVGDCHFNTNKIITMTGKRFGVEYHYTEGYSFFGIDVDNDDERDIDEYAIEKKITVKFDLKSLNMTMKTPYDKYVRKIDSVINEYSKLYPVIAIEDTIYPMSYNCIGAYNSNAFGNVFIDYATYKYDLGMIKIEI